MDILNDIIDLLHEKTNDEVIEILTEMQKSFIFQSWHIEDVESVLKDNDYNVSLSNIEKLEILERSMKNIDWSIGYSYENIRIAIDNFLAIRNGDYR